MSTRDQLIRDAIPVLTDKVLREVEMIMRHDIFHSTLDWQTKEELQKGAREAFAVYMLMGDLDAKAASERPQVDPRQELPLRAGSGNRPRKDVREDSPPAARKRNRS